MPETAGGGIETIVGHVCLLEWSVAPLVYPLR
jgi:hypothetical protein